MAFLKTPWQFNANGSLTVSFKVIPRRIKTLLFWQVVNIASGEDNEGLLVNTNGLRYPQMDGGDPYASSTAWDSSTWTLLGETPTTCSTTQQQEQVFTIAVPASANTRRLLLVREGVWKHAGDQAWVAANPTISCTNFNPEWYQSANATGFYCPVVAMDRFGNSITPQYNSGEFASGLDPTEESPDYIYPEEAAAQWLASASNWQAAFNAGLAFPFVARGEAVLLTWPEPDKFFSEGHPFNGLASPEARRLPSLTATQITSNVTEVRGNDKAVISLAFPSGTESAALRWLVGETVFNNIVYKQPGFLGTLSVPSTKVRVVGGTLSNLRLPITQRQTLLNYYDSPILGGTYQADFTPDANYSGTVSVELSLPGTNGILKAQDNFVGQLSSVALLANGQSPVVAITSQSPSLRIGSTAQISFMSSVPTLGFTASDVTVTNGVMSGFRASGGPATKSQAFSATVSPVANSSGLVTVAIAADKFQSAVGGYKNSASSITIPFDTVPPVVQITSSASMVRAGETATIAFSLNKPVTGLSLNAVDVTGGTLSSLAAASGLSYTATLTPASNLSGAATVTIRAGRLTDSFGNKNAQASKTVAVSTALPTVTITATQKTAIIGIGATASVRFSLSAPSTTFAASDVTVTGGALSGFSGSGRAYTATFTPAANQFGQASVSVAADMFTDGVGNGNAAAAIAKPIPFDTRPLTLAVVPPAGSVRLAANTTYRFTITPSKSSLAKDLAVADISVTSGKVMRVARAGTGFAVDYRPSAVGSVTLAIAAGQIKDTAGNGNAAVSQAFTVV